MAAIGRYQIRSELGQGGMGMVYRAVDPSFSREVAIKVLPRQFANDASLRARFEREAHIIAALEHPAIVPVYDFGEHAGQPFLVMRYMAGGSLSDRLAKGPLSVPEVVRILERLAPALDFAHQRGVIHRDLKPANILFDSQGSPYIADFGIAKIAEATVSLTSSGIIGTPAYMSPEQAQGLELDGRSDIYALGVLLFEMLTGRQPYQATTPVSLAMKHVLEPTPRLRDVAPHLPPVLDDVVQQAMAKQPGARFATAGALVRALRVASGAQAAAIRVDKRTPEHPKQRIADRPDILSPRRAGPMWAMLGLLVVAVLLLLLGVSRLGGRTTPAPSASAVVKPPIADADTVAIGIQQSPAVAPTVTLFLPTPTTVVGAATATPAPIPTPVPTVAATASLPIAAPPARYVTFSLQDLANATLTEGYVDPPLGLVTLGGVPFDLGAGGSVTTQAGTLPANIARAVLAVDVLAPQEVALLLTGGNLFGRFQDQRIGLVRLAFANGAEHQVPLVAGQNLREWKLAGDQVVTTATSPLLLEVWRGGNKYDNGAAIIDLLRVPIPTALQSSRLVAIEVRDLSLEMLGELDPAINWLGVAVLSAGTVQPQAATRRAVNLRVGPGQEFSVIRLLRQGEIVDLLGRTSQGDWLQVVATDGATGWAFAQYLDTASTTVAVLPVVASPPLAPCGTAVDNRLRQAYARDTLGCAVSAARIIWAAWQPFERGAMLWRNDSDQVTVFYEGDGWTTVSDQWDQISSAPDRGPAPAGRQAPIRGFGWIWGNHDDVFDGLGWATDEEKGVCLLVQDFERGFVFAKSSVASCADRHGTSNYSRAAEMPPLFVAAFADGAGWGSH